MLLHLNETIETCHSCLVYFYFYFYLFSSCADGCISRSLPARSLISTALGDLSCLSWHVLTCLRSRCVRPSRCCGIANSARRRYRKSLSGTSTRSTLHTGSAPFRTLSRLFVANSTTCGTETQEETSAAAAAV